MANLEFTSGGEYKKQLRHETLQDIEGLDAKECGFCRDVSGDAKGCKADLKLWRRHVVVVTEQAAHEWDKMLKGGTGPEVMVKALSDGLGKGADVKVSMASFPYSPSLKEGDVLVFEDAADPYLRKGLGAEGVATFVEELKGEAGSLLHSTPNGLGTTPAFALMCAHTKRDGRCGYCGPVLADLAQQAGDANLVVGKISHVGGHTFAGNVLMYDKEGNDWFGYITPELLPSILRREWSPTVTERWRGRLGYSKDALLSLEKGLLTPPVTGSQLCGRPLFLVGAASAAAAACLFCWKQKKTN